MQNGGYYSGEMVYFMAAKRKNKEEREKMGRARNNHWAFWGKIRTSTFQMVVL